MLLSIIIVSYNTAELTLQMLASVVTDLRRSPKLTHSSEIIVVDNASADDSVSKINSLSRQLNQSIHGPHLTLIQNNKNAGFAKANNQGIQQAQGTYVLLLNSDTIVQPGALRLLVEMMEKQTTDNKLGILSAQLLNPDGSVQPQGGSFPTLLSLASHMLMLDDVPLIGRLLPSTQHTGLRSTASSSRTKLLKKDWVGATAILIPQTVLAEIGLLDENIFMYGEDVELCLRAHNHHWQAAIHPKATIIHLGSASSSSANALKGELKGYLYIWSKHKPLWQMPMARFLLRLGCRLRVWLFGTMLRNHTRAAIYREVLTDL